VLLPELAPDERPRVLTGTSVGAVNTAYLAANAHRPATEVADGGVALWRAIRYRQVLAPLVSRGEAVRLAGYIGEVLGLPRVQANSILDPGAVRILAAGADPLRADPRERGRREPGRRCCRRDVGADQHTLATINQLLDGDTSEETRANEERTGRWHVPYMLIAPPDPDEIGRIATEVYRAHYGKPHELLRSFDLAGIGHLVSANRSSGHGELLSYLFFAPEFVERLIELGRRDAQRWLDMPHDDGRWQVGPLV
jgi:hypothetical protein